MAYYVKCDCCGCEFKTYPCYDKRNHKKRYCSKKCESESRKLNNTREEWRGGHIGKTTGYKYIRIDGKDVAEHILVIEKYLGRRLKEGEVVHHKNGVKTDNRIENLEIMSNSDHVKMHNLDRKNNKPCRRCGKEKTIHGRGLCGTCYHQIFVKGELLNW